MLNIIIYQGIQIKMIVRYHHKPTGMAASKNNNTPNHWHRRESNRTPCIVSRWVQWYNDFGKPGVLWKVQHTSAVLLGHFTLGVYPWKTKIHKFTKGLGKACLQ